jgi:hypothetical protein
MRTIAGGTSLIWYVAENVVFSVGPYPLTREPGGPERSTFRTTSGASTSPPVIR